MGRTRRRSPLRRSRQNTEQTVSAPLEGGVGVATPIVAPPAPCSTEVVAEHHGEPIVMAHIIPSSGGNGQGEGINRPNNSPTMYHQNPHVNLTNKDRFDLIEEGKIKKIADEIFALGTGISDDEIRKMQRVRISSKNMSFDQQVAAGEKVIKRLKDTLHAMTNAKKQFVNRAISAEMSVKADLARASEVIQCLEEKLTHLDADNIIWKDEAEGTTRELRLSDDRAQNLRTEIRELKEKLRKAEDAEKQALVGLEVEKARSRENEKRAQEWQKNINNTQEVFIKLRLAENKIQNQEDELKELKRELHEAKHASTQALIALELEKQRKEREKPCFV